MESEAKAVSPRKATRFSDFRGCDDRSGDKDDKWYRGRRVMGEHYAGVVPLRAYGGGM